MWVFATAAAQEEDVEEIDVVGEKPVDTPTGRTLDRGEIESFPAQSADELLRATPGLHLSAHGGNGKAFQFLVRGFDAEHGTDLLVNVEGVPINEPSNVHGQGYIDLHFLPTVLVDGLEVVKGSYRAQDGDFAITGAADYAVGAPEGLRLETRLGSDRSGGGTVAWRPDDRGPGSFLVAEGDGGIGAGDGRRFAQLRAAAGLDAELGDATARATAFAYQGTFDSPGVLREDDVEELGLYGAYPEAGGGASRRVLGIASLEETQGAVGFRLLAWGGGRQLALDQNYTGYLAFPVRGDGTRQAEDAADGGARAEVRGLGELAGNPWALRVGADLRGGAVAATERALSTAGVEWRDDLDARLRYGDLGGWTEGRLVLAERVTLVPGLRADRVELWARDLLAGDEDFARSGATVLSPKGRATVRPVDPLTLFVAAGRGFRSPDARAIADGDLAPVVTSDSAETGFRVEPVRALAISATGFQILVSNELLFDHVAGRFLSAGRTRRLGVEAIGEARPTEWLRLELDATYTDARFATTGEPIPFAPRWLVAGGAFAEGAPLARGARLSGGLRAFWLGRRPLPSGFASHPAFVGALTGAVSVDRVSVGVDVDNLFLGRWRDGEFVYPSWFDRTEPRSELQTLHVTAGDPFAARLVIGVRH